MYQVPILVLVFNRPNETRQVLERIAEIRPTHLFIGADGPRLRNPHDKEKCKLVRELCASLVNWPCEIQTRFLDENAGCRQAVHDAISWFFEHVEYGVILEDDCLPDPSFFPYAAELLERYRSDQQVMHVNSHNPAGRLPDLDASYFFTRQASVWGWATWSRAWAKMDLEMGGFQAFQHSAALRRFLPSYLARRYLAHKLRQTQERKLDSWAYAWLYSIIRNGGLALAPSRNIVRNIGFAGDATHTTSTNPLARVEVAQLDLPLRHPSPAERDPEPHRELQLFLGIKSARSLLTYFALRPHLLLSP